jgi:hypothetical protein
MAEFYLVIHHQHKPGTFIDTAQFISGRRVWWGPGAERKAKAANRKLNAILPAFHFSIVESVFTA